MFDESQRMATALGQQRNSAAKQDGNDGQFDRVDEASVEEASEQNAAAHKPDVFARTGAGLRLQRSDGFGNITANEGDAAVLRWIDSRGDDNDLLAQVFYGVEARESHLIRAATHEKRVELVPQGGEIVGWVGHDPVNLAVGTGDEAVEAGGDLLAKATHGGSEGHGIAEKGRAGLRFGFVAFPGPKRGTWGTRQVLRTILLRLRGVWRLR